MTSFAFILGVVPLVLATGAGAEMRRTLGIAVFSGMLGVTAFGIFFTPVFYSVIRRFTEPKAEPAAVQVPIQQYHSGVGRCVIGMEWRMDMPSRQMPSQPVHQRSR